MNKARARLDKELVEVPELDKSLEELKKEQRNIAFAGNKGAYTPHVYHVFTDPDFQQEVSDLRLKLETLYYKNISLTTSDTDGHLLTKDKQLLKDLADKYRITLDDLGTYTDGFFDAGYEYGKRKSEYGGLQLIYASDTEILSYVIGPKTTLEQITKDWPYIKGMRAAFLDNGAKENTKNKSPDDPALIYAIFKARINKLKFSKVFGLYQTGQLKGYENMPTNQFNSSDSLARYFRKYMPAQQNNEIINHDEEAYKRRHS